VFTGSHSHGQGHETTFAQVVATRLGIPVENVDVVHGDTGRVLFGMGTYGSRSLAVGRYRHCEALDKIVAKGKRSPHTCWKRPSRNRVQGWEVRRGRDRPQQDVRRNRVVRLRAAQLPARQARTGLNETAFYDPTNFTFPAGTHICEVEIDPDTGVVRIATSAPATISATSSSNDRRGPGPRGLTKGSGRPCSRTASTTRRAGNSLTGSLMDYALPRADDVPSFKVATKVTPCTHNPLGAKGCGEAGAIGAPAALMNAVLDALSGERRQASRHAGVAAPRVAGDPKRWARVRRDDHVCIRVSASEDARRRRTGTRKSGGKRWPGVKAWSRR